jgi:hypothetical protein
MARRRGKIVLQALLFAGLVAGPVSAEPLLSIAGTMDASEDYAVVLENLDAVGADATTLTLFWDMMEKDGVYTPDPNWPEIADIVYPAENLQLGLVISVIDTVADRRPADLQQKAFSDPAVIARFETFLTNVLTAMPEVTLTSISIGNEVDVYLTDETYDDFAVFFAAASDVSHRLVPDVPVGTIFTWEGLQADPQAQSLAALGDVWMINYYPLTPEFQTKPPSNTAAVLSDMLIMADRAPVMLTETGYPSGGCGASEAGQLAYTQQVLQFAEINKARMPLVTLVWMHDLSQEDVVEYADYYGQDSACFSDYLSTLGLRSRAGRNKPVFSWLRNR